MGSELFGRFRPSAPEVTVEAMVLPAPNQAHTLTKAATASWWPGAAAAVIAGLVAQWIGGSIPQLSTLLVAVLVGASIGNGPARFDPLRPGLAVVARVAIRFGIVLLGFRLAIAQIGALGWPTLALVAVTVAATFFGTLAAGRRLGLSPDLSLLVATGFSICGASAIAAMEPNSEAEQEEVAASIGLVTIAGTILMLVVPMAAQALGLSDAAFGTWVGASGPDVAQVVAAASTGGPAVISTAVVVKLSRIVLLAPLVTGVGLVRSRGAGSSGSSRPPLVPVFVLGFLATMLLRSTGLMPSAALDLAGGAERALFTVALVGLGSGVRVSRLRQLGPRPMVLGLVAWLIVGSVSLFGVSLIDSRG